MTTADDRLKKIMALLSEDDGDTPDVVDDAIDATKDAIDDAKDDGSDPNTDPDVNAKLDALTAKVEALLTPTTVRVKTPASRVPKAPVRRPAVVPPASDGKGSDKAAERTHGGSRRWFG